MVFKNSFTDVTLTQKEFVKFVWEETERQFKENNADENWEDLTKEEQIDLYCEQFEWQINGRGWSIVAE